MREPILITGCARSGTSVTAGVVSCCGVLGGDTFGPTRYNPKGMFENKVVREGFVKPFLREIGADPMGQMPLPSTPAVWAKAKDPEFVASWRRQIQSVFSSQGVGPDAPWYYKGAKVCLFWPLWHLAFPGAKWVLVRRSSNGIIRSCMRTRFMRAYSTQEGWQGWVDTHIQRFREMKAEESLALKEIWPEKCLESGGEGFRELVEWLGLEWQGEKVAEFVDPALWERR